MTFLKVTSIIQQNLVLQKQKSNLHHKIHQPSKFGMLGPNISSEIQHFLKKLIFGYSKNVTKFLTVIIKSNKDKSTMIILLLNTLHLYILFSLENISIYFDTVG